MSTTIANAARLATLALIIAATHGVARAEEAASPIAFDTIERTAVSRFDEPVGKVATSREAYERLFDGAPPPGRVDFARDVVAVIALGVRPTLVEVEITSVASRKEGKGGVVEIAWQERLGAAWGPLTKTRPLHVVRFPRVEGARYDFVRPTLRPARWLPAGFDTTERYLIVADAKGENPFRVVHHREATPKVLGEDSLNVFELNVGTSRGITTTLSR